MTQFIVTDAAGNVDHVMGRRDPEGFDGIPDLTPFPNNGWIYRSWQGVATTEAPTPNSVHRWVDGAPRWVVPLDEARAVAIQQIDAAGESLRLAVVNHMTMQTEEYRQALQQAQAWRAAGYPETDEQPAPPDVVSWAMAKWRNGWTPRQACDDILTTAALWEAVLSKVRMLRLVNKEDVRHAPDADTAFRVVADMRADMRTLAQQLGLLDQYTTSTTFKEF
jgi:hypothetical protein